MNRQKIVEFAHIQPVDLLLHFCNSRDPNYGTHAWQSLTWTISGLWPTNSNDKIYLSPLNLLVNSNSIYTVFSQTAIKLQRIQKTKSKLFLWYMKWQEKCTSLKGTMQKKLIDTLWSIDQKSFNKDFYYGY